MYLFASSSFCSDSKFDQNQRGLLKKNKTNRKKQQGHKSVSKNVSEKSEWERALEGRGRRPLEINFCHFKTIER